jgi:hypothetical protein
MVFGDVSLNSFFNILYDMAIILAIIAFVLGFLYLYASGGEAED